MIYDPNGMSLDYHSEIDGIVGGGKWIEYTFKYGLGGEVTKAKIDGENEIKLFFKPGTYTYTTDSGGIALAGKVSGSFTVVFADTWDAFEYGRDYFENATDYRSINSGTVTAVASGNDTFTYNFTERFRTLNPDSPLSFAAIVGNAGRTASGPLSIGLTDARMALQTYLNKDGVWNWRGAFAANSGAPGINDRPVGWNDWSVGDRLSSPYAIIANAPTGLQGSVPVMSGSGDENALINSWKINHTKLNNYNITSENVSNGIGAASLNENDKYDFTFNFTNSEVNTNVETAVHNQHYRDQLRRFASGTAASYGSFTSLGLSYKIDIYGRILEVTTTDAYVMNTGNSTAPTAPTTVRGRETIQYGTFYYIDVDTNGNPYAEQRGDGTAITATAPSMYMPGGNNSVISAPISVHGGNEKGDYSYEVISGPTHAGVTVSLPAGSNSLKLTKTAAANTGTITVEVTDNETNAKTTVNIYYSTVNLANHQVCVAEGTLVTLADGSMVPIETLKGDELLLVWNMFTGTFDAAPIILLESNPAAETHQIVHLYFSDGTDVKVIYEHAFFDATLNRYSYINAWNYPEFIGHWFNKQITDASGNLAWTNVQLTSVQVYTEQTRAYTLVTAAHFNFYANGMMSATAESDWLLNIFAVDGGLMKYDEAAFLADIEAYGLFTYEEFAEILPVPEIIFQAFNAQFLKVSMGKGLIDGPTLNGFLARFGQYLLN